MTPRQTSRPMKSASSSGPIGWLSPIRAPVSMSSAVPSPSSYARIASARNGIRIRLTMNPGRSADTMTCLPSRAATLADRGLRGVGRGGPADQLDQRHDRDRAEEVHPDECASPLRRDGLRQPRRSRSSWCSRRRSRHARASPSSSRQRRVLTSRSSKTASMTRSASRTAADVVGERDPAEGRVAFGVVEAALGDGPIEVARDPVATRLGPSEVRLVEDHAEAGRGVDLGDPVAHQTRSGDEYALDGHGDEPTRPAAEPGAGTTPGRPAGSRPRRPRAAPRRGTSAR